MGIMKMGQKIWVKCGASLVSIKNTLMINTLSIKPKFLENLINFLFATSPRPKTI